MKLGIVGLGWWGQKLVHSINSKNKDFVFTHAVTKEPEDVEQYAKKHHLKISTDLQLLIEDDDIEAIILATPHSLHVEQIISCAKAGKPVFCEKPLAMNVDDAHRAINACVDSGVVLGLGTNKRFWPSMRELKEIFDTGVLGNLLHVEGHYSNENTARHFSSWRTLPSEAPAAGLTGAGLHVLDALVSFAGPVKNVHAQVLITSPQPNPLDTVTAMFEFESGVSGTMATVRSTPFYWRIHLFGDQGSVEAISENEIVLRLKGQSPVRKEFENVDTLLLEIEEFVNVVKGYKTFHVRYSEMIATVDAFERIVKCVEKKNVLL